MRYDAQLEMGKLIYEVVEFMEKMATATKITSSPSHWFTEATLTRVPSEAALAELLYRSALSGDPDGSPGLIDVKQRVLQFHEAQAKRLSSEIRSLQEGVRVPA